MGVGPSGPRRRYGECASHPGDGLGQDRRLAERAARGRFLDAGWAVSSGRVGKSGDSSVSDDNAELLSDVAANGSVMAIAHGSLLSAVDLRQSYRLLRLPTHAATIRQIKVSSDGRRVASFADDQILRLFALPTGALLLELPLSLDFLALGERRHAELFAFSPDSRRLFALDCGERSGPACPLVRLRSFACERGERHGEIALSAEPIDYTSRSDGTIAILPTSEPPRFYDASSGMEWPQTPALPPGGPSPAPCQPPRRVGRPSRSAGWAVFQRARPTVADLARASLLGDAGQSIAALPVGRRRTPAVARRAAAASDAWGALAVAAVRGPPGGVGREQGGVRQARE